MKHDVAPYRRWDPKPSWQSIVHHPPPKYEFVTVRRFDDGIPFKAKLGSDGHWRDEGLLIVKPEGLQWLMPL